MGATRARKAMEATVFMLAFLEVRSKKGMLLTESARTNWSKKKNNKMVVMRPEICERLERMFE